MAFTESNENILMGRGMRKEMVSEKDRWLNKIHQGNVLEILRQMPDEFVDCIVTSPPYWGVRDYGDVVNTIWDGDPDCEHEWEEIVLPNPGGIPRKKSGVGNWDRQRENPEFAVKGKSRKSFLCKKCGAWYGQLGLEPTLEMYLNHLLLIMKELKRILKKTGIIFWNHNDRYGGCDTCINWSEKTEFSILREDITQQPVLPKCMALQNYRFITRCIDELGLILRNIIIWYRPNHMPCPAQDRFANTYEPVFMLVKNKQYWFDLDAVRIPHSENSYKRAQYAWQHSSRNEQATPPNTERRWNVKELKYNFDIGKNPGDVWMIPTQSFSEAHFATFPEKLIEPMIKAGCPQWICKKCGKARERIFK